MTLSQEVRTSKRRRRRERDVNNNNHCYSSSTFPLSLNNNTIKMFKFNIIHLLQTLILSVVIVPLLSNNQQGLNFVTLSHSFEANTNNHQQHHLNFKNVEARDINMKKLTDDQINGLGQQQSQSLSPYLQQQSGAPNSVIMTQPLTSTTTISQKPRYRTIYACEDRQLSIDCEYGFKINLIRANFGRFSIATCNDQGLLDLSIDCKSPITFRIMTDRCQNKQKCSVNATSSLFGDRCPKTRKYLEVHFQCQLDNRVPNDPIERVDLRNSSNPLSKESPIYPSTVYGQPSSYGPILPPNNPTITIPSQVSRPQMPPSSSPATSSVFDDQFIQNLPQPPSPIVKPQQPSLLPQQPFTVMNSEMLNYNVIAETKQSSYKLNNTDSSRTEPIVVTFRHSQTENMSNPRCVLWDPTASQWIERGSQVIDTNLTHTVCAFNQPSHYLLVMDYLSPYPMIPPLSQPNYPNQQQPSSQTPYIQPSVTPIISDLIDAQPIPLDQQMSKNQNQQERQALNQSNSRFLSLFWYLLAFIFISIGFMTIVFILSTMRSSAGAALKSLGNFSAFSSPKYKARRTDGTLHNKDLLVINNQNGHQFLYAPANTTKISSSSSTHILSGTVGHQGTLHQIQQPQLYSGNGTLSNMSGTGGQSNNYYYGLMGLNNLFQQQQPQQQHQMSQHHLNQQQLNQTSPSYLHQANKSTISTESANSSPSSSGVESGSNSVQQQHQQQQQSCLVMNNDYNLMGHLTNFEQNHLNNNNQPTLTLNAHYSSSGVAPMNMMHSQQQRFNLNQQNIQNREHIYECVDDDKSYSNRVLMPEQFNSNTLNQHQSNLMMNNSRALTLASRVPQNQQQQQQAFQIQQQQNNKRIFPHPAIIRDNQAKTSIICSKIAQVTPQRAIEINKFQHDVMAIYNSHDTTTTTTTTANSSSSGNSSTCYGRTEVGNSGNAGKLSTDC